jgi:hypothetical protein
VIIGCELRAALNQTPVVCGNGQPMEIIGKVTVVWKAPSCSATTEFLVAEELPQWQVIFGGLCVTKHFVRRDAMLVLKMKEESNGKRLYWKCTSRLMKTTEEKAKAAAAMAQNEKRVADNSAIQAEKERERDKEKKNMKKNNRKSSR